MPDQHQFDKLELRVDGLAKQVAVMETLVAVHTEAPGHVRGEERSRWQLRTIVGVTAVLVTLLTSAASCGLNLILAAVK